LFWNLPYPKPEWQRHLQRTFSLQNQTSYWCSQIIFEKNT
jgi:hypothetical protein